MYRPSSLGAKRLAAIGTTRPGTGTGGKEGRPPKAKHAAPHNPRAWGGGGAAGLSPRSAALVDQLGTADRLVLVLRVCHIRYSIWLKGWVQQVWFQDDPMDPVEADSLRATPPTSYLDYARFLVPGCI